MNTTFLRAADGGLAHAAEAIDERGVLRDGYLIQKTVSIMDSPRTPVLTDEERARKVADVEARNTRLSNAWRDPAPQSVSDERRSETPPTSDAHSVRAERDRRLEQAWQH